MSGGPQFPDPLGNREVYRPGATASKAGPDLVRRVQNLEQGAAGRPGPGVANGSVITSDTSQTGGVKWQALPWSLMDQAVGRANPGATTTFVLSRTGAILFLTSGGASQAIVYLNPADIGTTCKVKVRAWAQTEADPTDSTLTFSLVPVSTISSTATITATGSTVISSSLTPNAAGTLYTGETTEATLASAGYYIVTFAHSANPGQSITYGYRILTRAG